MVFPDSQVRDTWGATVATKAAVVAAVGTAEAAAATTVAAVADRAI
jgi:hypothetical protein